MFFMHYFQVRLLSMLEEYMIVRQEKELEKKRQRVYYACAQYLYIAYIPSALTVVNML